MTEPPQAHNLFAANNETGLKKAAEHVASSLPFSGRTCAMQLTAAVQWASIEASAERPRIDSALSFDHLLAPSTACLVVGIQGRLPPF